MSPSGSARIAGLRRRVAAIEAGGAADGSPGTQDFLPLGIGSVDAGLGGGLALGALHEASARAPGVEGSLLAFGLALAALAARTRRRPVLMVQQELDGLEGGWLYGPGAEEAGLPEGALILVRVRRAEEALLVMEEALKCSGLSAVLGEVATPLPDALTATRRLSLAARAGSGIGLLLRPSPDPAPCAAVTRWRIAPEPSRVPDAFGGLGPACISAHLTRNRHGPPGAWRLVLEPGALALAPAGRAIGPTPWEARHESGSGGRGAALSQPVARPALNGPDRTLPAA